MVARRAGGGKVTWARPKGTAGLAKLAKLRSLMLWGDYSDETARVIGGMGRIRRLTLVTKSVTDEGVACLARLTQLEELVLPRAAVTDASAPVLGRMENLRHLDLRGTKLTAKQARELQSKLPRCDVEYNGRESKRGE
jgi:hypothetical protein